MLENMQGSKKHNYSDTKDNIYVTLCITGWYKEGCWGLMGWGETERAWGTEVILVHYKQEHNETSDSPWAIQQNQLWPNEK